MRVVVDRDLCQGHGVCEGEAPEVFQVDNKGVMKVLMEHPPERLRAAVEAACQYCPQQALSISDD